MEEDILAEIAEEGRGRKNGGAWGVAGMLQGMAKEGQDGTKLPVPRRILEAAARTEAAISETYAELTPLRAAIASIPVIGSPVDAFFGTRGQNIAQRRFEATLQALCEAFQRLNGEKADRKYLESEEFFDLIQRVFESGQRTRDEERVHAYAAVLRGAVERPELRPTALNDLELITALTPEEFVAVQHLYRRFDASYFYFWDAEDAWKLPADDVSYLLSRLEGKGVIVKLPADMERQISNHMARVFGGGGGGGTGSPRFSLTHWAFVLLERLKSAHPEEQSTSPESPGAAPPGAAPPEAPPKE